jgi:hypothetical protein
MTGSSGKLQKVNSFVTKTQKFGCKIIQSSLLVTGFKGPKISPVRKRFDCTSKILSTKNYASKFLAIKNHTSKFYHKKLTSNIKVSNLTPTINSKKQTKFQVTKNPHSHPN